MIAQKTVSYATEFDVLMEILVVIGTDVKAGKAPAQVMADVMPSFVAALAGIRDVGPDLASNKQVVLETIGYKMGDLVNAFI